MGDVAICTEMGRFMMGPYGCLVTKAIHEKQIYKDYIGVDASAVDLIRPAMYGAYHHITVMGQPGGDDKTTAPVTDTYDITGNLCENNDKFAIGPDAAQDRHWRHRLYPRHRCTRLCHGLQLQRQAAQCRGPAEGGRLHQLIRRAETPEDYFATFDFSPFFKK